MRLPLCHFPTRCILPCISLCTTPAAIGTSLPTARSMTLARSDLSIRLPLGCRPLSLPLLFASHCIGIFLSVYPGPLETPHPGTAADARRNQSGEAVVGPSRSTWRGDALAVVHPLCVYSGYTVYRHFPATVIHLAAWLPSLAARDEGTRP